MSSQDVIAFAASGPVRFQQHSICRSLAKSSRSLPKLRSTSRGKRGASSRPPTCTADAEFTATPWKPPAPLPPPGPTLVEGIKAIAIGKNGEKPIPMEAIPGIVRELEETEEKSFANARELHYLRASFLGALFVKQKLSTAEFAVLSKAVLIPRTAMFERGIRRLPDGRWSTIQEEREKEILALDSEFKTGISAGRMLSVVDTAKGSPLHEMALRLLCGERLSEEEAYMLGLRLYTSDKVHPPIKALVAHVMRVRHEDENELRGLSRAVKTIASRATASTVGSVATMRRPCALLAEPFDGVDKWDLVTPLVAKWLRESHGLLPIMLTGRSSGPKFGPNLKQVADGLSIPSWQNIQKERSDVEETISRLGYVADQEEISLSLSSWVDLRRTIVKRPALATAEKYADVCAGGARIFIASAFHPNYVDKMAAAAEAVGFASYVIIGKGVEGCIGLGVGDREARLVVGWRVNGEEDTYVREEMMHASGVRTTSSNKPKKGDADVAANVSKIEKFVERGRSGDRVFDGRVQTTTMALDKAIRLIKYNVPDVFD